MVSPAAGNSGRHKKMYMFWGILIGVLLTVLTVVLAIALGKKDFTPLSYVVIVLALVAFCIEGIGLVNAINARKNADNTVTALQEAALTYISDDSQNYRLGLAEATGVKIGLRLLFPSVAGYIEPADIAGHTLAESSDVLKAAVLRNASHKIWMNILYMAITLVLATVLTCVTMGLGGGGHSHRGNRSGRVAVHGRAPRVGHRGSRR